MKRKLTVAVPLLFVGLMIAFFVWVLVNVIHVHASFNVDYAELQHRELTFEAYEVIKKSDSPDKYALYFEEYDEPFEVSRITQRALDKKALDEVTQGATLEVYYQADGRAFSVCELTYGSVAILKLSDYTEVNQSYQRVGILLLSVMIALSLFIAAFFLYGYDQARKAESRKNNICDLGKIKMEYRVNENVIRVYNSFYICSLVINDTIVDQHLGLSTANFLLKATLNTEGREIPVEVRLGFLSLALYVDGQRVDKAFA